MKNLSILTLLTLSLLTLSCGKDKDAQQQPSIIIDTVTTNSPKAVSVLNLLLTLYPVTILPFLQFPD